MRSFLATASFAVVCGFLASGSAHAATAVEYGLLLRDIISLNVSTADQTVPHALMAANGLCPCMTELGCIPRNAAVSRSLAGQVPELYTADGTPTTVDGVYILLIDVILYSNNTAKASSCVDLTTPAAVSAGCGLGESLFGTAECGACTDAALAWCPGVGELPATCFSTTAGAVRTGIDPNTTLTAYDIKNFLFPGTVYGSSDTFGLTRDKLLAFDPSSGGCPFSSTDVPTTVPTSCPAEPVCVSCTGNTGGSCACATSGCCTEERAFWNDVDLWPASCVPNFTRATPFWPGGVTMGAAIVQSVKGDKCVLLARAWISAQLSICSRGACTDATVHTALADAKTFLFDTNKCPDALSKQDNQAVHSIISTLNDYNSGLIGPGPCTTVSAAQEYGADVSNLQNNSVSADTGVGEGRGDHALIVATFVIVIALVVCATMVVLTYRRRHF